ncbi:hypothetical protein DTO271D3_6043 [Paecilomyces variotii]|nr:hypothetical protein DTO271D3_6043 [Paecilomyces variotii]
MKALQVWLLCTPISGCLLLLFFQLVLAWRALRAERTPVPAPAEFFRGSCANCVWSQKTDNSNLRLPESKLKPEDMMLFDPAQKDGVLLR